MRGALVLLALGLVSAARPAFAEEQLQSIVGIGLDGKPCEAQILRDDATLKKVTLVGAAESFLILTKTEAGYRGEKKIVPNAGANVFKVINEEPEFYPHFHHQLPFIGKGEVFVMNTEKIPLISKYGHPFNDDARPMRMVATLSLVESEGKLVKVEASSKMQLDLVPALPPPLPEFNLSSETFVCEAK